MSDEVVQLERRIAALEAELRATADALRARDEMIALVAHDLRNPLGPILMGASALCELGMVGELPAARVRSIAERIQRQADRMVLQIGNLTDFAELQAGRLTLNRATHAPNAIIGAVSEMVGPLVRERGTMLETRVAVDLPAAMCDAERVVQALTNLCTVAIKVTSSGGAIELGARRDRGLVFFVRDHGPGVDREELATIFEPAWRSRHMGYRGAGLGLAIARGIVVAHGGRIWADSAPGSGMTVAFSLSPGD